METLLTATLASATTQAAEDTIGADLGWKHYPAEQAHFKGTKLGPSRKYLTPEAEAVGRSCVKLQHKQEYVEFKVEAPADALVVRFCIPDDPEGNGLDATLSMEINGLFVEKLNLTSRYSWIYGDFPWSNHPSAGKDHHFWDEYQMRIPAVNPGDTIRLVIGEGDDADFYLVDFIELELVPPPLEQPDNSLSISDYIDKSSTADVRAALVKCIESAKKQNKTIWIPAGEYQLEGDRISLGGVQLQGAGMWHTRLTGRPMFEGTGERIRVSDLALFGEIAHRDDESPDNAFNGNLGDESVFSNLWVEHLKCGFWTTQGTSNMLLENSRIRNLMADGLNFCDGTSYSTVRNCHFRNTGDDALASWSPSGEWSSGTPCVQNSFIGNTIELPWLANGIAVYGGRDHLISGNDIRGTVFSGGGILVSSNFEAIPFAGTIKVERNRIQGAGGDSHLGEIVGGIFFHAAHSDVEAEVVVEDLEVSDSSSGAVTFHGKYGFKNVKLKNIRFSRGQDGNKESGQCGE